MSLTSTNPGTGISPTSTLPQHVAIIMDGNGRWASEHGLPRARGHEQGAKVVRCVAEACRQRNIPWLTLFAFSTENWGRPKAEVNYLMRMLRKFLAENTQEMGKNGIRLCAIGELNMLPPACRRELDLSIRRTARNTDLTLTLALSYGARQEITMAARRLAEEVSQGLITPQEITPELLAGKLYTAQMPDPDLLIRTSGEMRLSNYLLWQLSYAELWVTPVLWPDFDADVLDAALTDYAGRRRRYGKH